MSFESFLIAILVVILANILIDGGGSSSKGNSILSTYGMISALLMAPLLETVICQVIPVGLARKVKAGEVLQIAISMFVFAFLHFKVLGAVSGLSAGLVGGFYLSYTYVRWRERDLKSAYWSTVAVHSLYNFFIISTVFFFTSV